MNGNHILSVFYRGMQKKDIKLLSPVLHRVSQTESIQMKVWYNSRSYFSFKFKQMWGEVTQSFVYVCARYRQDIFQLRDTISI